MYDVYYPYRKYYLVYSSKNVKAYWIHRFNACHFFAFCNFFQLSINLRILLISFRRFIDSTIGILYALRLFSEDIEKGAQIRKILGIKNIQTCSLSFIIHRTIHRPNVCTLWFAHTRDCRSSRTNCVELKLF